jgi:hypothetical protein
MYERGIYEGVAHAYSCLRRGEEDFDLDRWKGKANPAMRRFHEGYVMAVKTYIKAALASQSLREWICRRTYYDNETPPQDALRECASLSHQFKW